MLWTSNGSLKYFTDTFSATPCRFRMARYRHASLPPRRHRQNITLKVLDVKFSFLQFSHCLNSGQLKTFPRRKFYSLQQTRRICRMFALNTFHSGHKLDYILTYFVQKVLSSSVREYEYKPAQRIAAQPPRNRYGSLQQIVYCVLPFSFIIIAVIFELL